MRAQTLDGREIELTQSMLDALRIRIRGPVFAPGDLGYEESRTVWNAMIDRRPALVARCLGVADVIASVRFAREHDILLCIKGGGHNIAGLATADGALMLDLSLMRGVWVDAERKIAHAQAGCVLGDVDRETQLHGLATVLGFVSLTGIAGLTLGGGFGYALHPVAPIKAFGHPIGDVLVRRPYAQMQALLDATQPKGRRYYWKSEYLPRIEPGLCEKVIEHAAKFPSPHSGIILFQVDGALNRLDEAHSPVGNRDARHVLNIAGSWEQAGDDGVNIEWARAAWDDMKSFSTGGTYINFLTEDEGPERIEAALGRGLPRLAEVKARWDPENVFRTNRNIKPV